MGKVSDSRTPSRHSRDLAHDLVLIRGACNSGKSDVLRKCPKHFDIEERSAPGSSSKAIFVRKPTI